MSTIFKVFGMIRPEFKPTTYRCKADALPLGHHTGQFYIDEINALLSICLTKVHFNHHLETCFIVRAQLGKGKNERIKGFKSIANINLMVIIRRKQQSF